MADHSTEGPETDGGGAGRNPTVGTDPTAWGHLAALLEDGEVVAAAPGFDRESAIRGLQGLRAVGDGVTVDFSVDEFVSGSVALNRLGPDPAGIPVRMSGTAFQVQVWDTLREIPPGRLVSYAELAAAVGRPGAVRAAASACAANRLGLIVPCHRVVRSDGSIGGYRWGEALKRRIIETERASRVDSIQAGGDEDVLRAA
jgi:AraC family transcriptional regulator of adaptative response/methylated-DNA-[protein]-cysteine methyltransferase